MLFAIPARANGGDRRQMLKPELKMATSFGAPNATVPIAWRDVMEAATEHHPRLRNLTIWPCRPLRNSEYSSSEPNLANVAGRMSTAVAVADMAIVHGAPEDAEDRGDRVGLNPPLLDVPDGSGLGE